MELNKLDLNKLLTFLAITEAGGLSAAAPRLALSRSALSHSLGALEAALGVSLFHRVGKSLVLTREGHLLRGAVGDARERLGVAIDELLGSAAEARGPVRIGLFLGFSRFRLARVADAFLRENARARIRVAFGPQAWLLEQLLAANLDFTLSLRPTREQASHVHSEKLFVQSLVLVVRKGRKEAPTGFDAIARLPIVDYYPSDPLVDRWSRHHFGRRRIPREHIRAWVASTDLALELVLRGVGAAVLPEDVTAHFRRRGELALIRGPREPLRDAVWLNELRGARRSRATARFRDLLFESLRGPELGRAGA
ncbi:MAG: LysR family transcriptional regulator [Myxococcota bacterium]